MLVPTAVKQKVCFYRMKAKQSQSCCEGTTPMATPPSHNVWEKVKYWIRSPETCRESELTRYSNIINVRDNHMLSALLKPPPPFSKQAPLQLFHLDWKMFGAGALKEHFCVSWNRCGRNSELDKSHANTFSALNHSTAHHNMGSCLVCLAPIPLDNGFWENFSECFADQPIDLVKKGLGKSFKIYIRLPKPTSQNGDFFSSSEYTHSAAVSHWHLVLKERRIMLFQWGFPLPYGGEFWAQSTNSGCLCSCCWFDQTQGAFLAMLLCWPPQQSNSWEEPGISASLEQGMSTEKNTTTPFGDLPVLTAVSEYGRKCQVCS